jgi:photosystem II stability/assembly factor-like uncharacterized protein
MIQYLTVWGSNSNGELNIPERLGQPVGLNSNLVSGYRDISKFYLGARHGIASKPSSQNYFKPLYSGNVITGYEQIIVPINNTWGDNTFFQLLINRTIGNLTFYYDKFDLGNDTTYAIDAQLGLIHGFGFDLMFSDIFNATGQIVNWTSADFDSNGIPPGNLALYPRGFKDVKAGDGYVLALNSGNKITGWGNSGHPVISGQKYSAINTLGNIKEIAAGRSHALVLFNNGSISGWGDNSLGQLNFNNPMLKSGVKISTKLDYNLALGFKAPLITRITGNTNMRFDVRGLGSFDPNRQITGLKFQFSLNRKDWESYVFPTGLNSMEFFSFTGGNLPTGDNNYYVRLVESYDTFCENTGWQQQTVSSSNIGFRGLDMSFNGQYQTFVGASGGQSYPFISSDYGKSWTQITGTGSRPGFWSDYAPAVKLSKSGNLQLIAGPRSASFSGPYRVFLSYDFGNNWTVVPGSDGNALSYMDASDDFKVIAIPKLSGNFISISHNSGATWFHASGAGSRDNWRNISVSDDGKYILAGVNESNQALFKSANSGVSWTSTSGVLMDGFTPVKVSKNGQIQLAGATSNGLLHISRDYGSTWEIAINDVEQWLSIDISDDNKYLLATTNSQRFYRSENSGVSWDEINLSPFYGVQPPVGIVAISSDGRYQSMVHKFISAGIFVYTNCNFGLNPVSGTIENTGSASIYNPNKNIFDLWTDYRVFGWGGGNPNMAVIPERLKNERIIDIAAGYENNIILTENPIAEDEVKIIGTDTSNFLDSDVLVSGAGLVGINRAFFLDGESNDRPLYRLYTGVPARSTNVVIFWNNTSWGLYSGLNNLIYYSLNNVEYPWLGEWEGDDYDYYPVPSILELPSFIEELPSPCTGFIFDIS